MSRGFAKLRAAGLPASGAELNVWRHPVPELENGALVLTQAFSLLRTFPDSRSNEIAKPNLINRTNEWSEATHELMAAYVRMNAPAITKAHEALLLPHFYYPVDFSYGPDTVLPHLVGLKKISLVAGLDAVLQAEQGRADEWPSNVELHLKLAASLEDEPSLISFLVRNAILRMAVNASERSLNLATPSADVCSKLQNAFSFAARTNLLPLAFTGERAMMIPVFRLSWSEIHSRPSNDESGFQVMKPLQYSGKPWFPLWLSGLFERDLDHFLKEMDQTIALASLPLPERLGLTNHLIVACNAAPRIMGHIGFTSMLLQSFASVIVRDASTHARIELTVVALGVERFRHERGHLPDHLAELTPHFLDAVPRDPFDGAPLRYKRMVKGYIIYSIGSDGHDDGGREPPAGKKIAGSGNYDITFTVKH
ncbi:MAG: hypothetical protein C5B50_04790 [Verrucomicrobia bacterium]|nr:MAG: hypothetical protein C5B50_04790 [Verrucomicrobiota bacterium]